MINIFKAITLERIGSRASILQVRQFVFESLRPKASANSHKMTTRGEKNFTGFVSTINPLAAAKAKDIEPERFETGSSPFAPVQDSEIQERIQTFINILTAPNQAPFHDPIDQVKKELVQHGKLALEALLAALTTPLDEQKMGNVIEVLGKIGDPRAANALLKHFHDPSTVVREAVVKALGSINDPRLVDPLIEALQDNDKFVRANAAKGLGKIGDMRAFDPLITALNDKEESVWLSASEALHLLKNKKMDGKLVFVLVK
jgi:hypothetical protein